MTQQFQCGDGVALAAYLYDECDAGERAQVAAHLALCPSCAGELAALSGTRQQLSAWTPPDARLEFRLTGSHTAPAVGARGAWWSRPLPAWAQLAAAGVIFAVGTVVGSATSSALVTGEPGVPESTHAAELTMLEDRLRQVEQLAMRTEPVAADAGDVRAALMSRLSREIEASELRQQQQVADLAFEVMRDRQDLWQEVTTYVQRSGAAARFATQTTSAMGD
jgi:anti-sigma factor RsiW